MIQKRKKWNSGGVSDIIGDILIMAITVTLFSTIFVFVQQMPVPTKSIHVDFSVDMEANETTGTYNILNITHIGGKELKDYETGIYLSVDGTTRSLPLSSSITSIGDTWSTGETALFDCSPAKIGGVDIVNATKVSVMIISNNVIVWQGDVRNVGSSAPVIMERWVDSDPDTSEREAVMTDDDFSVFVKVEDVDADLNTSRVFVNMSSLGLGVLQMLPVSASQGDTLITFIANATTPANIPIGYYYFTINATDNAGHEATARLEVPIGGNIGTNPNLVITSDNIWVDPSNPTRGDDGVRVYVKIVNYGKVSTTFSTYVYDTQPDGTEIELGNVSSTIPAGGPETIYVDWPASLLAPSGNHTITATAVLPLGVSDADPSDNTGSAYIQVMPKILVVDDDGASFGSDEDTTSMILAALDSADYRYDRFVVTGVNGPDYNSGLNKLADYDVVIWDTGHQTSNTLTTTDEANLEEFMNNGGNLWLLGEDILNNLGTDSFIQNYIHVTGFTNDTGPDSLLFGSPGSCLNGTVNVTTIVRNNIPNSGDIITTYSISSGDEAGPALESVQGGGGNINALWYDDTSALSRRVFFPFELSSVEEPALQAEITYKVLKWLGNVSYRMGRDLAVSEQTISPTRPFYSQPVTISAVVRNNGMLPEPNVEVAFWIDGQTNGTIKDPEVLRPGESWRVNYTWIPRSVGTHTVVAEVDPYNIIEETNENNNRVSSYLSSSEIYIQYRILVVDDDGSANNGGSADWINVTAYATDALDSLGYDYELYVVPKGDGENGPDSSILDDYNAVLWFTGEDNATLTAEDQENLSKYMDGGGFLWLDSQSLLNDLGTANTFLNNYLKVGGGTTDTGVQGNIYGTQGDVITHGMNMLFDPVFTDGTDTIIATGGGTEILWNDTDHSSAIGVRYKDSTTGSRMVFTAVDISGINGTYVNNTFTDGNITREYFVYMIMHWFNLPEERPELLAASSDISVSDAHPQLGESYVIRATVRNVGGESTSALVRFMDGDTLVGSDSIYVAPGETTTTEVVWVPLFAGMRTITIQIDPVYEIPNEVFRFNDNPYISQYVYFFWDDMENGSSKWQHESTIININGESPIDYLGSYYTTTYTDVIGDWDDSLSVGVNKTDSASYSSPNSYWLQEVSPTGSTTTTQTQTVPMDVVFALDTSGSMSGTKIDNLKQATKNFIGNLTDQDRAAIYTFDGNGHPYLQEDFAYMTAGNKNTFNTTIDGFTASGGTPFYDTLGEAINYSLQDDPNCSDNSRLEVVVGMTDGVSNSDDKWSPEADWLVPTTEGGGNSGNGNYLGLLKSPPMVFTIGLLDNGSGWGTPDYHDDNYPTAPDWSHSTHPDPNNYNIEYELWHVADSSLWPWGKYGRDFNKSDIGYSAMPEFNDPDPHIGHYYYTEDSSQLTDIFAQIREIAQSISSGGGTAPPGDVTRASNFNTMSAGTEGTRAAPPGAEPAKTVLSEGFEGGAIPSGWTTANTGHSSNKWEVISSTYTYGYPAYDGTYMAGIKYDGSNQVEGWLISKKIDASSLSNLQLSFYDSYEYSSYGEVNYVKVSTTDQDPASFTDTVATYDSAYIQGRTDNDWVQQTIDLSAYAGKSSLYIAWEYTGKNAENWYIDDVSITGDPLGPPGVLAAYPGDGSTALPSQYVAVVFNKSMDTSVSARPTLTQTGGTDPGNWIFEGWFSTHKSDDTAIWSHDNWTFGDSVTMEVSDFTDSSGVTQTTPYSWSFSVMAFTTSGGGGLPPSSNTNKTAVTPVIDLSEASSAMLTFWQRYNIVPGANGAFLEIGYKDSEHAGSDGWAWRYIIPSQGSYTGNMDLNYQRTDSFGHSIVWAWNGVSGKGTFSWEFVKVNLLNYVPDGYRSEVRIKFNYTQYGGGTGYGWYLDDVKVAVSRADTTAVTSSSKDAWQLTTNASWSGSYSWWNGDPGTGYLMPGIDNSLETMSINLINARNATLSAYFRFNINTQEGAPPDGFRVEVSSDNGVTWHAINLGARSSWGVSGSDNSGTTSYTGHNAGSNWTQSGTLTRLNCDLSDWSGSVIMLRFRVVTTNAENYDHYESPYSSAGFGGFYIDDVVVLGETINT